MFVVDRYVGYPAHGTTGVGGTVTGGAAFAKQLMKFPPVKWWYRL